MSELDARKQIILQAIVLEYVLAAEPVASEMLVQRYPIGVKSATIRNEMAELSELGYLEQPHTSAGRIPSDQGYRYFVDRLIVNNAPDAGAKQRLQEAASDGDALQSLLRDTARVLSRVTQQLSVATTVRDQGVSVRNAVVSALGPSQALLVLVLSNGHVENRMLDCPTGLTLDDVGKANELLSLATSGKTLKALVKAKAPSAAGNPAIDKLLVTMWGAIKAMARELTRGLLITEGEEFMFGQPEFQHNLQALYGLLDELTTSDVLYEAVATDGTAQVVTIGKENRQEKMQQLSVIRHSFYVGEAEAGVIALVGPTRMRYEMGIPLVNFTAQALSQSLTKYFG